MIEELMPPKNDPESLLIICGPPRLKEDVVKILNEMDYRNYYEFN